MGILPSSQAVLEVDNDINKQLLLARSMSSNTIEGTWHLGRAYTSKACYYQQRGQRDHRCFGYPRAMCTIIAIIIAIIINYYSYHLHVQSCIDYM